MAMEVPKQYAVYTIVDFLRRSCHYNDNMLVDGRNDDNETTPGSCCLVSSFDRM
jgi:hypothetical protein